MKTLFFNPFMPGNGTFSAGGFVCVVACAAIIASQLANFVFTPALPAIGLAFGASAGTTQLLMTAFLVGYASIQIVVGPLADYWGRKPVLLIGTAMMAVGATLCWMAPYFWALFMAVFIQAMGAGILPTVSLAMVRDRLDPARAARIFAMLGTALAVASAATPLIGSSFVALAGWRAVFGIPALMALLLFVAALRCPETMTREVGKRAFPNPFSTYRAVLRQTSLLYYALMLGAVTGAMAIFFTGAPFLFIHVLKLPVHQYGIWMLVIFLPFIAGTLVVQWLMQALHLSMSAISRLGCAIAAFGTACGWIASVWEPSIGAIVLSAGAFTFGLGIVVAIGKGAALAGVSKDIAASSALISFIMIAMAAAISAVAGVVEAVDHESLFRLMFLSVAVALAAAGAASRFAGHRELTA